MATQSKWTDAIKKGFQGKSGNWVVNRGEVKKYQFQSSIPSYVSEYLFSYQNPDRLYSETHAELLRKNVLVHRPQPNELKQFKDNAMKNGAAKLFDRLEVEVDVSTNSHSGLLPHLDEKVVVDPRVTRDVCPDLLKRPIWGIIDLAYSRPEPGPGKQGSKGHFVVRGFTKIETVDVNPKGLMLGFQKIAKGFGEDSLYMWFQILLATMFRDPEKLDLKDENEFATFLNYLTRLVPLVEPNSSIVEMGPPGTGKTSGFTQHSPYAMAVPCRAITRAKLFYDVNRKQRGAASHFDCIAIDDIQIQKGWDNIDTMMSTMMQYLTPGPSLGDVKIPPADFKAHCSIAFLGNTDGGSALDDPDEYFKNVPSTMREQQFLERLNGFIDGAEIGKITNPWDGHAIQGDIFGRLVYEIRRNSKIDAQYSQWFRDPLVEFKNASSRCKHGIGKLATGLLKLLYPAYPLSDVSTKMEQPPKELLEVVLKHAVKLRHNVRQLIVKTSGYQTGDEINYKRPIVFKAHWK